MFRFTIIAFLVFISYYINLYHSFIFTINDDITPKLMIEQTDYIVPSEHIVPSDDNRLNIMITEYYKDLNTYIMPTEKILPLEVFHDNDGVSFSKTLYECVEYYNNYNQEIMRNTKHMKIIIINIDKKSYCIMNTDLII